MKSNRLQAFVGKVGLFDHFVGFVDVGLMVIALAGNPDNGLRL